MKVYIKDIKPEGIELSESIASEAIGETDAIGLKFAEPLKADIKVEKVDATVIAQTHVHGAIETFCSRCLEPLVQDFKTDFTLDFEVKKGMEFVELGDDVRQEIILSLPFRSLCKESCLGLCQGCGINLNKEKCKCKQL